MMLTIVSLPSTSTGGFGDPSCIDNLQVGQQVNPMAVRYENMEHKEKQ